MSSFGVRNKKKKKLDDEKNKKKRSLFEGQKHRKHLAIHFVVLSFLLSLSLEQLLRIDERDGETEKEGRCYTHTFSRERERNKKDRTPLV